MNLALSNAPLASSKLQRRAYSDVAHSMLLLVLREAPDENVEDNLEKAGVEDIEQNVSVEEDIKQQQYHREDDGKAEGEETLETRTRGTNIISKVFDSNTEAIDTLAGHTTGRSMSNRMPDTLGEASSASLVVPASSSAPLLPVKSTDQAPDSLTGEVSFERAFFRRDAAFTPLYKAHACVDS